MSLVELIVALLFPSFARASVHMSLWQPSGRGETDSVAPLVEFFELVHLGDTIQQMVQVFFDKEMVRIIRDTDQVRF
jgi:recyclin-1